MKKAVILKFKYFAWLCLFFLLIPDLFGQPNPNLPIDEGTKRITYSGVVTVDSTISQYELYSRGREWFAKTYNSATDVIQMEDKEAGKIIGKALMPVYWKALGMSGEGGHIRYTISVYFKDGKFRYEIADFIHEERNPESGRIFRTSCEEMMRESRKQRKKITDGYLSQLDANVKELIVDLTNSLSVKPIAKKEEDW